jgi:diaminohydroxyphosphoribosylaminopyrimidine deaminase/5-amino-6-(5-phosphoribosylamino)uracil reductase
VILKLASSMDGRIATAGGGSRWITGPEARAAVHRLRERVDAVVVGSGTALTDDPELTARRAGRLVHAPIRVLVDSGLRVPPDAKLHRGKAGQSWVLCGPRAPASRRRGLAASGARLLDVPARGKFLDLRRALRRLAREGLTEVLVEGGGKLAGALLRAGLVDEVHWYVAPRLLGGDARPALGALGLRSLARAPQLAEARVRRVGRDVHWVGRLESGRRTKR